MSEATGLNDFNDAPRNEPDRDPDAPFVGLSHDELLAREFADDPDLVDGIVPRGALGTIAAVPEAKKSWLALAIAEAVARGEGEILGRNVVAQGSVGYWWQDDTTRAYAERVQLYSKVRETPPELPLRWFLNEGVALPDDVERIASTVEHYGFVLVVVDSVYNFVPPEGLRDTEMGSLYADLKWRVCDRTGATVLGVDHMPWATEANRGHLRAYGDVFKGAAARFGIYIDANRSKLHVEARGNNIRGFPRTPAYWDADRLELRLVEGGDADTRDQHRAEAAEWIVEYVTASPGLASGDVVEAYVAGHDYKGARSRAREAIAQLLSTSEEAEMSGESSASTQGLAVGPGESPSGKYLYPALGANSPHADDLFGEYGESDAAPDPSPDSPTRRLPVGGASVGGESKDGVADDLWKDEPGAEPDDEPEPV